MNSRDSPQEAAFRSEARTFLEQHAPPKHAAFTCQGRTHLREYFRTHVREYSMRYLPESKNRHPAKIPLMTLAEMHF